MLNSHRRSQEQCLALKSLHTPFKDVDGILPVVGILFTVTAITDIEILTFELDVILNEAMRVKDPHVEVFAFKGEFFQLGDYLSYESDSSKWSPLFASDGVLTPEGKDLLLLPAAEFTPIALKEKDTYSFYVTMRGPFLDCVAQALKKRVKFRFSGTTLQLLSGQDSLSTSSLTPWTLQSTLSFPGRFITER